MFNEGKFTQILEGERPAVESIFESIRHDPRRAHVTILATQTTMARRFESWAMAFVGTSPAARAYYKTFTTNTELFSKTILQDNLCRLMLEMIDLDQREPLSV